MVGIQTSQAHCVAIREEHVLTPHRVSAPLAASAHGVAIREGACSAELMFWPLGAVRFTNLIIECSCLNG